MIDARTLTVTLQGQWHGNSGSAACPLCQPERRPSQHALAIRDGENGRLLLHCHKTGCSFAEIWAALHSLRLGVGALSPSPHEQRQINQHLAANNEDTRRSCQAQRIWREAEPIVGTVAERYLRRRGIACALPSTLRFHPHAHHPTGQRLPAMVAHVEGADWMAVHRTYLQPDGSGKAKVQPAKAMLGSVRGGAVRLIHRPGPLVVAEGIETALSLASDLLRRPATIWAALSTSGLRGLTLPCKAGQLIIAADGDQAGFDAATALARRSYALGWQVYLLRAPEGQDWNDVLRARADGAVA